MTSPAGWYDDPSVPGKRHWDGQRWTGYHASLGPSGDGLVEFSTPEGSAAELAIYVLLAFVCGFLGAIWFLLSMLVGGCDDPPCAISEQAGDTIRLVTVPLIAVMAGGPMVTFFVAAVTAKRATAKLALLWAGLGVLTFFVWFFGLGYLWPTNG
jgi:hypothetical protein